MRTISLHLLLIVYSYTTPIFSLFIDNQFVDSPAIVCNGDSIGIAFKTRDPFSGHVFVKDLYSNPACRDDYDRRRKTGRIEFSRNFTSCGVRRQRSLNPAGMYASLIVKIAFHPRLVSKLDHTVWAQCFYAPQRVAARVSTRLQNRPTLSISDPMPVCHYDILGAPDGNPINLVTVGQTLYHRWTCDTAAIDIYCMTVHSCVVDAGDVDNSMPIIDKDGCTLDPSLIANPEYSSDLRAMMTVNAFKYPDISSLFFNCQVKIERKKTGGSCSRPNCIASSSLLRIVRRHISESTGDDWYQFSTDNSCDSSWKTCVDVGSRISVVNRELASVSFTEAAISWLEEEVCLTPIDYNVLLGGSVAICVLLTAYVFFAAGLNQRL